MVKIAGRKIYNIGCRLEKDLWLKLEERLNNSNLTKTELFHKAIEFYLNNTTDKKIHHTIVHIPLKVKAHNEDEIKHLVFNKLNEEDLIKVNPNIRIDVLDVVDGDGVKW